MWAPACVGVGGSQIPPTHTDAQFRPGKKIATIHTTHQSCISLSAYHRKQCAVVFHHTRPPTHSPLQGLYRSSASLTILAARCAKSHHACLGTAITPCLHAFDGAMGLFGDMWLRACLVVVLDGAGAGALKCRPLRIVPAIASAIDYESCCIALLLAQYSIRCWCSCHTPLPICHLHPTHHRCGLKQSSWPWQWCWAAVWPLPNLTT